MSHWVDILSPDEITAHHALTASLDPSFAKGEREWHETRTEGELRAVMHQRWLCNEGCRYQLARSYLAMRFPHDDAPVILWAATSIDIRPSRCYPVHTSRVVIEGEEIRYRDGYSDPLLFRDRAEADSFIESLSEFRP